MSDDRKTYLRELIENSHVLKKDAVKKERMLAALDRMLPDKIERLIKIFEKEKDRIQAIESGDMEKVKAFRVEHADRKQAKNLANKKKKEAGLMEAEKFQAEEDRQCMAEIEREISEMTA